jgi:hypothetical protein
MPTEHMPATFFNEIFHHPDMVADMDAEVLQGLLAPFFAIPGHLAPTQVLVVTSVTHPRVVYAMKLAADAAPVIGAVLTIVLGLVGV